MGWRIDDGVPGWLTAITGDARIASEEHEIRNARCLICALLQAVLDRLEFNQRTGITQSPDEFLNELRKSKFNPGQPMGAGSANVVRLWRKESQRPPAAEA